MKKIIIWLVSFLIMTATAQAQTIIEDSPACISEELYNQFQATIINKDERGLLYLIENGCMLTKSVFEVSQLDMATTGTVKIRIYAPDGTAFVLWTNKNFLHD